MANMEPGKRGGGLTTGDTRFIATATLEELRFHNVNKLLAALGAEREKVNG